ncbi:hypothetical protein ABN028_33180 [Actinopolymorpha sp. B17G11]|uniref:hypothetical protein n=1 Tax=Actinopolymorpha sp. B17G11 TaxID=3160861 RepID=UPI0032E43C66
MIFEGELADATSILQECLRVNDQRGEQYVRSYSLHHLALAEWRSGSFAQAAAHARHALRIKRTFSDLVGIALAVELLAWIAADEGAPERATVLLGVAQQIWQPIGQPLFSSENWTKPHQQCEAGCRLALGDQAFEATYHRGRNLTTAVAVAYALSE